MSEQDKYYKKYLKYKKKYISLENQMGGGKWDSFKAAAKKGASVASSIASNPAVKEAAAAAATTAVAVAAQQPSVQAKLAQAQQAYNNSPSAQLAAQVALSHPAAQSAMAHPVVQQLKQSAQTGINNANQNPDDVWNTLSLTQKQKLISMLSIIN